MQALFYSLGINSGVLKRRNKIRKMMPNGKGGLKEYDCQENFELIIYQRDFKKFLELFNFIGGPKFEKIKENIPTRAEYARPFAVITEILKEKKQDVYCIAEDKRRTVVVNGYVARRCGEISGLATLTTVCLLGSVNLTQYVDIKDEKSIFNWEQYKQDVRTFARMLDNVCDLANAPLPSYEWAIKNFRQYGMGINGLGSAMMMLGIPYNSIEAMDFAREIAKIKENITLQVSALLAKEKGLFPVYNKEKFENTEYFKSDRLTDETKTLIRKHGVRNAKTTTNPPAGTTAIICDNTSNGIEPVYLLEYERKVTRKDWPDGMTQDNVRSLLKKHDKKDYSFWEGIYNGNKYYYEPHNRGLCDVKPLRDYGYQWLLDNFPDKDHSKYLISTKDLSVEDHIAIQSIMQRYCNQSISKTVNLPKKYPFEEFKDLYLMAWKNGLVGLTTYREGSMESVLSSIDSDGGIIKKDLKLPNEFINGPTTIIKREGMKFYIHFSYFPDDSSMKHPVCMWIYTNTEEKGASAICNKASRELARLSLSCGIENKIIQHAIEKCKMDYPHNRLGRMVSLCLRHNISRVDVLTALRGIEGDNVSTLLTSVRKFIGKTIEDGTPVKGIKCKNEKCNSDRMIFEAGCVKCADCGNQDCGT
jgi:ribonucleoside-diphosphate reductase alpha chain